MFNSNPFTLIPTDYLVKLLDTADHDRYDIENELCRRTAQNG
jgi:hypothetical protein